MGNKLRFDLAVKAHPYPQAKGSDLEKWGCISISILSDRKKALLIQTEWDLSVLIKWIIENQNSIRNDILSINGELPLSHESLAQALRRLQEQEFPDEEKDVEEQWFDQLFEFRQHHDLRFALRGAKVPGIIIGCNHGVGEISLSTEDDEWFYSFDLDDFLNSFQSNLTF